MTGLIAPLASGIVEGFVIALVAVGFTVIFNATGVINFANGQMMVTGAYVGWVLFGLNNIPFLIAVVAAALVGGVMGLATDRVFIAPLRKSGLLVQVTALVAWSSILDAAFLWIFGPTAKNIPPYLPIAGFVPALNWSAMDLGIMAATSLVIVGLVTFLYRTDLGLDMRATASNSLAASLLGINPKSTALIAWCLGGALAAVGGILIFPKFILDPNLGLSLSLLAFAAVVLGGFGSVSGAIVGGLIIGVAQALISSVFAGGYEPVVSLVVMVVVLSVRPTGLVGERA